MKFVRERGKRFKPFCKISVRSSAAKAAQVFKA
jgi:hypothetical protein